MAEYSDQFKDPRWQRKRLEIFERDGWSCQSCGDAESTLNVHHMRYLGNLDPWDYPNDLLITLCEECHKREGDERPGVEEALLGVLREKFLLPEIKELAAGFQKLELLNSRELVASAFADALSSPEIQRELLAHSFPLPKGRRGGI